nr:phosphatidylinositol 3-kinase 2-like [Ipomoea batatas]
MLPHRRNRSCCLVAGTVAAAATSPTEPQLLPRRRNWSCCVAAGTTATEAATEANEGVAEPRKEKQQGEEANDILQSQIRSPSETPIIDLSVDEKVDDSNVFVPETVTTIGDLLGSGSINQSIEPILPASDQNVEPGMPISESTALTSDKSDLPENTLSKPKEKIYESEEGIPVYVLQNLSKLHSTITQLYDLPADPLVGEKNFVVTPAYTIKPKPTEETYLEIEMTKVIDEPIEAITELSLVELEIAHPKSTPFKQSLALTALNSQYNNDNNALLWPLGMGLRSQPNNYGGLSSQPLLEQPLVETTNVVGRSNHSPPSDQPPPPKNPKKRTRASRRAPTTVLTTDTTNFRQMVQEFTGIPAGPFSGSGGGSLYSRCLDLFSTAGSSLRTAHSDPLGAFHHRPLGQKVHSLPLHKLSGQNGDDSPFCHKKAEMPSFIPSSSNTNFQLSTEVGVTKQQSSALFNMEDQILAFQPLLQSSLKNPLGNHEPNEPVFGSKSRGSNSHLSAIDGLGIGHEQASGFLGQGSANNSDQARNCSTSSAHDKGLENAVRSGGDGDAGSSWPCPN